MSKKDSLLDKLTNITEKCTGYLGTGYPSDVSEVASIGSHQGLSTEGVRHKVILDSVVSHTNQRISNLKLFHDDLSSYPKWACRWTETDMRTPCELV